MKSPLAQNTAKSSKNLAKAIAKQIAQEPAEILKTAREQVLREETSSQNLSQGSGVETDQRKKLEEQEKISDKLRSQRHVEALNRELADIKRQNLFKDLQKRIGEGEEVPLEDYPELSLEQRQVLTAQMQAVREQKTNMQKPQENLAEPAAKKGRKLFNFGKKTAMKREQTHVEKPVPPSG